MMHEIRRFGIIAATAAAAACASAGGRAERSRCPLTTRDSTYLARGPVYRDCAVDEKARLTTTNLHPDYQPTGRPDVGCFAAEVEFVVDSTGVPEVETARVVRANSSVFGDAVLAMVRSLRYEPAKIAGARVRQIVSERRTAVVGEVVVPKGSAPPTRGGSTHVPNC
jgi:hypothetical protein